MAQVLDVLPQVQPLVDQLVAGGATHVHGVAAPPWIVGTMPSGALVQLLWSVKDGVFRVSRWSRGTHSIEQLGTFPGPAAALACALAA